MRDSRRTNSSELGQIRASTRSSAIHPVLGADGRNWHSRGVRVPDSDRFSFRVDSSDEIVGLLGEEGLGSNSLERQDHAEGAMGALLGDSADLAARLGDPRLELDTISRTYLLLGAVLQRASASPASSMVDVLAMLSATQSALGTLERAEFLTGVALARVRKAEASADDVDVIGVLRDNSLRIGFPTTGSHDARNGDRVAGSGAGPAAGRPAPER